MTINEVVKVLDKGYVRLIKVNGDDLDVVNAARVSYNDASTELTEKDIRLLNFLAREGHMSPFRHVSFRFEVYAPLMVARQWWKHHVASSYVDEQNAWNESSRRYVKEDVEFYEPDVWRLAPDNAKQGSGADASEGMNIWLNEMWEQHIDESIIKYDRAIDAGIAPEMARLFLPANGLYIRFNWHVGLEALTHFLNLRVAKDSQKEIQEYAKALETFLQDTLPHSYSALKGAKTHG